MASVFHLLLLILYIKPQAILGNVDCISANSISFSVPQDDAQIYVECGSSYYGTTGYDTLTGCGFETKWPNDNQHDGSWGDGTRCTAQYGANNPLGGVYAWARCCDFTPHTNDVECIRESSGQSTSGDDDLISSQCDTSSAHKYLTGCSYSSNYLGLDGSFSGTTIPKNANKNQALGPYTTCTAQNGAGGGWIRAEGICCSSETLDLTCKTWVSSAGRSSITYSCPNDNFIASCSGYSNHDIINAAYVNWDGDCYVRASSSAEDIWATVICCRIETPSPTIDPTTDPTEDPTKDPTEDPTIDPTIDPTEIPTTDPTINPTIIPTIIPTINPTILPTTDPTINPTLEPTFDPTLEPTLYPTNSPSITPSYIPSSAPTQPPSLIPTQPPSFSPSQAPTQPPTLPPTPNCPVLFVTVLNVTNEFNITYFDGLYTYIHGDLLSGRPQWKVPQHPDDQNIQYISPNWHINGIGSEVLTHASVDFYPPLDDPTEIWSHSSVAGNYHVNVHCVTSFAPITNPTSSPSQPPTISPTITPSLYPSISPSIVPSISPTLVPSIVPSNSPSIVPSNNPSVSPSINPSNVPSLAPSLVPSLNPSISPSNVPSNHPSIAPSLAPSIAPSISPTSHCPTLIVNVSILNGISITSSQWDGYYELHQYDLSFNKEAWYAINTNDNNRWIKYIGTHWVINGDNDDTLTHLVIDDSDNYPPIGTFQWNHESIINGATVNIRCGLTYSPSPAPTMPPSSAPTYVPTSNWIGVFVTVNIFNGIYNKSFHRRDSIVANRSRFIYNNYPIHSTLLYDFVDGWTIIQSNNGNIENIYKSFTYGLLPPLNRWQLFGTKEFYIEGLLTEWPTYSPSITPIIAPSLHPTKNPTKQPSFSPTISPTNPPILSPTLSPTLHPTPVCDVLSINVPNGFPDVIAETIFSSSLFIFSGLLYNYYPYWILDCDNNNNKYTHGCLNGYIGQIYYNGYDSWIIYIHSEDNDYYKIYSTESSSYFVPLNAIWIDLETIYGISQSSYSFIIDCNQLETLSPSAIIDIQTSEKGEQQHSITNTKYIYDETWFIIAIILIIFIILFIIILIYCFTKYKNTNNNKNKNKNAENEMIKPAFANNNNNNDNVEGDDDDDDDLVGDIKPLNIKQQKTIPIVAVPSPLPSPVPIVNNNNRKQDGDGINQTTTGDFDDADDAVFAV